MTDKAKILFVDDEQAYLNCFKRQMRSEKAFMIETACDGQDALEKLNSFPADIAIVDLIMPNMDGLELLKKIRELYPDILVMILTGSVNIDNAILAMKLGAYDYILKPFEPDMLAEAIQKAAKHQLIQRDIRAVHEKVKLLGDLVDQAGYLMVLAAHPDGRITEYNALTAKTLGFNKEEMLSHNMERLFMMNSGEVWGQIAETVRKKSHWRGELTAVCKGGRQLPVYMAANRSKSDEPRSPYIVCFVRDISMEKEINHIKSQFISVVSHELIMPLTSIKNAVDIILAGKTGVINQG